MVCSPEISRMNGAKSKGATTPRSKAIASRNAIKHGLLAQNPPLLITENLTTFEGLIQGLIDHYEPENPVEHFLVQQVAVGMLKQYRLWSVESAIANIEILKAQQLAKFPDMVTPPKANLDTFDQYVEKRTPLRQVLDKEKRILQGLISDLDYDLSHLQEQSEAETLEAFRESAGQNYNPENRTAEVYQEQDQFDEWLGDTCDKRRKKYTADLPEAIARVNRLTALARQRIEELDQPLSEIDAMNQKITQAETASKGLQNPELFARYQREINRDLYAALDRLEEIRKQRNNQGFIGSFRQVADSET